jgi:hypothetical protein
MERIVLLNHPSLQVPCAGHRGRTAAASCAALAGSFVPSSVRLSASSARGYRYLYVNKPVRDALFTHCARVVAVVRSYDANTCLGMSLPSATLVHLALWPVSWWNSGGLTSHAGWNTNPRAPWSHKEPQAACGVGWLVATLRLCVLHAGGAYVSQSELMSI